MTQGPAAAIADDGRIGHGEGFGLQRGVGVFTLMMCGHGDGPHWAAEKSDTRMILNPRGDATQAFDISDIRRYGPAMSNEPAYAIEIEGLTKTYASSGTSAPKHALKGVDLTVERGSFFGLLGPNGAGKSTLINILAGLVFRTSGSAKIWGYDIEREMRQARRSIGIVPQEINFDPFFTPWEMLELQAGLYGIEKKYRRSDEILELVGLSDKREAYVRALSGGMKRRLLVAKAMVHSPKILVLDEPTAGVDVELRRQLWKQVRKLNDQGVTILLTTHYLEEAEELCDKVAIINHGDVIACEETSALMARMDSKALRVTVDRDIDEIPAALSDDYMVEKRTDRAMLFSYAPSRVGAGEILEAVRGAGFDVVDVSTREAELEDVFLQLTSDDTA